MNARHAIDDDPEVTERAALDLDFRVARAVADGFDDDEAIVAKYRDHAFARRQTFPEGAVRTAIERARANGPDAQSAADAPGLIRVRGRDIRARKLDPLWPGVLYRGKAAILAGLPGDGKSLATIDLVARLSRGDLFPASNVRAPVGYSILLTAEDDPEDTLRPRLDAAGANPDRYEVITGVRRTNSRTGAVTLDTVSLIADLAKIEAAVVDTRAALLVIDPLTSFAASDTNATADMRRLLDGLGQMAGRTGVAVLIVTHLNKRADARKAMHAVAGSHVIVAGVRTAFATARDPHDASRRLILPLKLNIAKEDGGFAFTVAVEHHEVAGEVPVIRWDAARVTDLSADDALIDSTPRAQAAVERTAEVQTWLREQLRSGPVEARRIFQLAEEAGYSERRVRNAQRGIGAVAEVLGYQGRWHWRLPDMAAKGGV